MGYLTEQIADEVGRLAQERGREYYRRGAVQRIEGDSTAVKAIVQGTLRYRVEIIRIDDFVDYSCSCPYYERELEPCKHIWAACLAAERRGYLAPDRDARERDRLVDGGEPFPSKPAKAKLVKKPSLPTWKEELAPVIGSVEATEHGLRFAAPRERGALGRGRA